MLYSMGGSVDESVRLWDGRMLTASDTIGATPVAVISRSLAIRFFRPGHAIGRSVYLGDEWPDHPHTVVGIVEDEPSPVIGNVRQPRASLYLSVFQHPPRYIELRLRDTGSPEGLGVAIRNALGPDAQITRMSTVAELMSERIAALRWFSIAILLIATIVFLAGTVGTMVSMHSWMNATLRELALRRAVGAKMRSVGTLAGLRVVGIVVGGAMLGVAFHFMLLAPALERAIGHMPKTQPAVIAVVIGPVVLLAAVFGLLPLRTLRRLAPARVLSRP
jgi:putative ABC transport system permease protein